MPEYQVRKPDSHSVMPMQPFFHILSLRGYSTRYGTAIQSQSDKTDISGLLQSSFTVISLMYPWELCLSPGNGLRSPLEDKTHTGLPRGCVPVDRIKHHDHNDFQTTHGNAEPRL